MLAEIRRAEALIAEFPLAAPATDEPGIRRLPVTLYPYIIFYEIADGEIVIHRVRHAARREPRSAR